MNVVALLGSPRAGGNTDILLAEALRAVDPGEHRLTVFRLNGLTVRPCQNCGGCEETGRCVISDDMDGVYAAIREADRIILASPIYFLGLSAQTKAVIDRCQAFWCEKYLLKRPLEDRSSGRKGLLLLVSGMKSDTGVTCGEATARAFFRSISVSRHETLRFTGIDEQGAIRAHPTALDDAYRGALRLLDPAAD